MERTSYSKLSQRDVDRAETDLLINLSAITQRGLAKMIGCHESKISRTDWRFIASVLCAFGMASDISPISRAFKYALDGLTNKKRPAATERSEQIQMEYSTSAEVTLPNRSVMWQISMMVTPDYQICCLRLIQAQI